jgi:hypothetical protein
VKHRFDEAHPRPACWDLVDVVAICSDIYLRISKGSVPQVMISQHIGHDIYKVALNYRTTGVALPAI